MGSETGGCGWCPDEKSSGDDIQDYMNREYPNATHGDERYGPDGRCYLFINHVFPVWRLYDDELYRDRERNW